MSLLDRLTEDMKAALKSKDKVRLETIRLLRGQLQDARIAKQGELSPEEEIAVLTSAVKKRREAIEAYEKSDRLDLLEKEKAELAILQAYLPEQLSAEEIAAEVDKVIAELRAASMRDFGAVMKETMARLKGRAEGKVVQQIVREKLGGS